MRKREKPSVDKPDLAGTIRFFKEKNIDHRNIPPAMRENVLQWRDEGWGLDIITRYLRLAGQDYVLSKNEDGGTYLRATQDKLSPAWETLEQARRDQLFTAWFRGLITDDEFVHLYSEEVQQPIFSEVSSFVVLFNTKDSDAGTR